MSYAAQAQRTPLRAVALAAFFAITFAITWSVIGAYILWPAFMVSRFGEISGIHPFYFLATWAPAISAVLLVLTCSGVAGLRGLFSRLLMWQCPPVWWAFILLGLPLIFMIGSLIKGGPFLTPLPPEGAGPLIAVMFMMLFLGPVEELGWRSLSCSATWRRSGRARSSARPGASGTCRHSTCRAWSTRTEAFCPS